MDFHKLNVLTFKLKIYMFFVWQHYHMLVNTEPIWNISSFCLIIYKESNARNNLFFWDKCQLMSARKYLNFYALCCVYLKKGTLTSKNERYPTFTKMLCGDSIRVIFHYICTSLILQRMSVNILNLKL